jgi:hypothetical protein
MINSLLSSFKNKDQKKQQTDLWPIFNNSQVQQRQLFFQYQQYKKTPSVLPSFSDTGFRVFSQSDEDGLLLYIFALIGFTNKICIDIAFASPFGSNTTNLICNWGFQGFLIEAENMSQTEEYFKRHIDTSIYPPTIIRKWITAENINEVFKSHNLSGEIDLLSLDVDGVDYWLLKALNVVTPRVIVLEYQDILGPNMSATVPYKPDFNRFDIHPDYFGASLSAFVKLAQKKNYRLVGINKYGYNAFFVKNGLEEKLLPKISIKSCFNITKVQNGINERYPLIKKLPWKKV